MSTQTTTTQAASGAEGFVLVPKQATKAMLDAAYAAHDAYEAAETGGWGGLGSVYEAMVAAAPVTGTEEDHRELRAVMRRLSAAKNAGGIEDAEAQAQVLGHAVDACIGQIREFLATAPQPAGAERVDLGELERLSAAASQGEWSVERMENHGTSSADKFFSYGIECGPHTILDTLNSSGGMLEQEHDEDWTTVWDEQARRDLTYIAALVNAHRAGHLVPASLPAALGSGEGTAGATASSGRGWRQDCFRTRMEAFDRAYRKAGETSQPQDWMDAALLAQQFRNVAYAVLTDEAPKQEPPASTGWVLVPREPTDAMIQDGGSMLPPTHRLTDCYDYFREAWAAALDARPIPPSALAGEAGTPSSTPHPQSPSLSEVEEAALSRAHADGIRAANWTLFTHEQSLAIRQKYLPAALATLTASQEQDGEVRT